MGLKASSPPLSLLPPALPSDVASLSDAPATAAVASCSAAAAWTRTLADDVEFWQLHEQRAHLGRGCYGTVLLVRPRDGTGGSRSLAVKITDASADAATAFEEAILLDSLRHPNIVSLERVFASPTTLFMLMEAEEGGDLQARAAASPGGVMDEAAARAPFRGVLAALGHMHARGALHRDVKASNVLLSADGQRAKLCDFGLAARLPPCGFLTSVCGTHDFLAPEMILSSHGALSGYDAAVDMWAVGLMLHGLLIGTNPFERETDVETLHAILEGEYDDPAGQVSDAAAHLLRALLVTTPSQRATAAAGSAHAWVRGGKKAVRQVEVHAMTTADALRAAWPAGALLGRLWARAG